MKKFTHLNAQCHRFLIKKRSRTFSSTKGNDGTYYDSQSARWITPHDPTYFRLTIVANNNPAIKAMQSKSDVYGQLKFLSERYNQFSLPISSNAFHKGKNDALDYHRLDSAIHDSLAILSTCVHKNPIKIPMNAMLDIIIHSNDSIQIEESKKFVAEHFQIGNRIRCTMTNFDSMAPWVVGCIAAELCDAGCEEIFLDNRFQDEYCMDIDDLIQVMEEICYIVSIFSGYGSTPRHLYDFTLV